MSQNPSKARLARISQPSPPAPVGGTSNGQRGPYRATELQRATLTDDEDLASGAEELLSRLSWREAVWVGERSSTSEDTVDVLVAVGNLDCHCCRDETRLLREEDKPRRVQLGRAPSAFAFAEALVISPKLDSKRF